MGTTSNWNYIRFYEFSVFPIYPIFKFKDNIRVKDARNRRKINLITNY